MLYLLWQITEGQKRPIMRTITVTNSFSPIYSNESIVMTRTTDWRYLDNTTSPPQVKIKTHTSTRQEGETRAEFYARHDAECAALYEQFPPIADQ